MSDVVAFNIEHSDGKHVVLPVVNGASLLELVSSFERTAGYDVPG